MLYWFDTQLWQTSELWILENAFTKIILIGDVSHKLPKSKIFAAVFNCGPSWLAAMLKEALKNWGGGGLSAPPILFCRYTLFSISPLNAPSLKEVIKTCTKINTLHEQVKTKHNTLLKRKRMHLRIEKVFFIFNSRHFATLPNNRTS